MSGTTHGDGAPQAEPDGRPDEECPTPHHENDPSEEDQQSSEDDGPIPRVIDPVEPIEDDWTP